MSTVVDTQLTATDERRIAETLFALLADMEIDTDRALGPTLVVIGVEMLTGRPAAILLESHAGDGGDATRLIGPMVEQGLSVIVLTADPDPVAAARCLEEGDGCAPQGAHHPCRHARRRERVGCLSGGSGHPLSANKGILLSVDPVFNAVKSEWTPTTNTPAGHTAQEDSPPPLDTLHPWSV